MFEDGSLVKHTKSGYEGLIDGQTSLRLWFTGNKECKFQYRVKFPDTDKRLIAPEEDLTLLKPPVIKPKRKFATKAA
jgi:hypothetical protein